MTTLTPPSAFSGSASFGFSYDALSRRTQMTRPNSISSNYAYDNGCGLYLEPAKKNVAPH